MSTKRRCTQAALGLLIATMVLSGACSQRAGSDVSEQVVEDIKLEEAFTLIEDNRGSDNFTIIDLRLPEEYAGGHIEEAINLDYSSPDFPEALDKLDREVTYLIYSYSDEVSGKVLDEMADLGFTEVYNMLGGMEHWEDVGLPQAKE